MDLAIITDDWPFDENVEPNNIRKIVALLKENSWSGVMSLETKGEANTLKSVKWFRGVIGS